MLRNAETSKVQPLRCMGSELQVLNGTARRTYPNLLNAQALQVHFLKGTVRQAYPSLLNAQATQVQLLSGTASLAGFRQAYPSLLDAEACQVSYSMQRRTTQLCLSFCCLVSIKQCL